MDYDDRDEVNEPVSTAMTTEEIRKRLAGCVLEYHFFADDANDEAEANKFEQESQKAEHM